MRLVPQCRGGTRSMSPLPQTFSESLMTIRILQLPNKEEAK